MLIARSFTFYERKNIDIVSILIYYRNVVHQSHMLVGEDDRHSFFNNYCMVKGCIAELKNSSDDIQGSTATTGLVIREIFDTGA
jgi:hypothetical protein